LRYIARETRAFAGDIGMIPSRTPYRSPQSNGMAEALVKTFKRDYVRVNPTPDAPTVLRHFAPGSPITILCILAGVDSVHNRLFISKSSLFWIDGPHLACVRSLFKLRR
jgi:hypothetical protein